MPETSQNLVSAFIIDEESLVRAIEEWLVREAFELQDMASDNQITRVTRAKRHRISLMSKLNAVRLPYDSSI